MLDMIPIRGRITDNRIIPTISERMITSVGSSTERMDWIFFVDCLCVRNLDKDRVGITACKADRNHL